MQTAKSKINVVRRNYNYEHQWVGYSMQLWSLGRMSAGGMRYESLVHVSKLSQLICYIV